MKKLLVLGLLAAAGSPSTASSTSRLEQDLWTEATAPRPTCAEATRRRPAGPWRNW